MELTSIHQNLPISILSPKVERGAIEDNPGLAIGKMLFSQMLRASGIFKSNTEGGMFSLPPMYADMLVDSLSQELAKQHEAVFKKYMLSKQQ